MTKSVHDMEKGIDEKIEARFLVLKRSTDEKDDVFEVSTSASRAGSGASGSGSGVRSAANGYSWNATLEWVKKNGGFKLIF